MPSSSVITRRFSDNWFLGGNYTWSRLYGNYAGLSNTDEIAVGGWSTDQSPTSAIARPGGNANRSWDSDEILFDANGNELNGRLQTDRPHVLKMYGSYEFPIGNGAQWAVQRFERHSAVHHGREHEWCPDAG